MSTKKWFLIPLLIGLSSCVAHTGTLNLEGGQVSLSQSGDMQMVMDTIPLVSVDSTETLPANSAPVLSFDAVAQLRNDFEATQTNYNRCVEAPKKCDVTRISAPDSPQRTYLTQTLHDYAVANIRSQKGSGVKLVRIDSLSMIDAKNAIVNSCTYDSIVLVDAGATDSLADDIIFNETVSSYLTTWMLKKDNGVWKIFSRKFGLIKFNTDQCGFSTP